MKSERPIAVRKWSVVLAMALLLGFHSPGAAATGDPPDTQLWNEVKLTLRLNDHFDLVTGGVVRLGDDISQVIRTSGLLAVNVRIANFLTLTPSYQYIVDHPVQGRRTVENRLGLAPTLNAPLGSAKLALSNALEYRSFDNKPDSWRWRPKMKLSHPLGLKALALSAYTAGELFYEFPSDSWTRSRLFAGLEKRISNNAAIEVYYCRQIELKAGKQDLNIIGISWRIDFERISNFSLPLLPTTCSGGMP